MSTLNLYTWDILLEFVEEGRMIIVLGDELLRAAFDGSREESLQQYLGRRMADALSIPASELGTDRLLSGVVNRHLERGGDRKLLYPKLKTLLRETLVIPEPLRLLADIDPLKLFINTTFNGLMEAALAERRGAVPGPMRLVYAPNNVQDLACDIDGLDRPVVYYLMGYPSASPSYAITEEDLLEFVCALQSESRRPKRLFEQFRTSHLLILGCNFPEWLIRFFVRLMRNERFINPAAQGQLLADSAAKSDPAFCLFLRRHSQGIELHPCADSIDFVRELHSRWKRLHPESALEPRKKSGEAMARGAIFISYAHDDIAAARTLRDHLEARGLDVWLDETQLGAGDVWRYEISRNIRECSAFLALISRNTNCDEPRFFRREWNEAIERSIEMPPHRKFIFPVIVDRMDFHTASVPNKFHEVQFTQCPGGVPGDALVTELVNAFRLAQKASGGLS